MFEKGNIIWPIFWALIGAYSIFSGVKIILTGSLSAREEARLANYSNKGARTYKLLYSVCNIVSGLVLIAVGVLKYLEGQDIVPDILPYYLAALVVIVVSAVVMFVARSKCEKMTDDE